MTFVSLGDEQLYVCLKRSVTDVADCPFGTSLLLPHVPLILGYLHQVVKKFSSSSSARRGRNRFLPTLEISVLSRCV